MKLSELCDCHALALILLLVRYRYLSGDTVYLPQTFLSPRMDWVGKYSPFNCYLH